MPDTPQDTKLDSHADVNMTIVIGLKEELARITQHLDSQVEPAAIYFPTLPFSARDWSE